MTHHFIIPPAQIKHQEIVITGNDLQHLSRVLRLKAGAAITVADGRGRIYSCVLEEIDGERAIARAHAVKQDHSEPPVEIILLQGLPKGDKLELIIQKATELGVARIIPVAAARSVVRLTPEKAAGRQKRWQKIAAEAAKQCGRNRPPLIGPLGALPEVLASMPSDALLLVPWEEENSLGLGRVLTAAEGERQNKVILLIGPEGGLEEQEVELARERGGRTVSLGPRILRTETAAIATLAVLMYQLGDLGGHEEWLLNG